MTAAKLDEVEWAHTTRAFQALGHRFAVRSTDGDLGRFLDRIYAPCATSLAPHTWYSDLQEAPSSKERLVYVDQECIGGFDRPSRLVRYLTWHVNHEVIERTGDNVLVHAAAAERNGAAIVMAAPPEAGKTTLVAGLLRSSFQYVTDEAVAFDPGSGRITAYPKPLSVDPGSWPVLADLAPDDAEMQRGYHEDQWHVTPAAVASPSGRPSARLVVFPRFDPGSATRIEPVPRAEGLVALARQTFRFHSQGRRNLGVLGRVVAGADCYRLVSGDLDEACELLVERFERSTSLSEEYVRDYG